jgi:hypothetical protein
MDVTIDISKNYLEKYGRQLVDAWNDADPDNQDQGYRIMANIELDELETSENNIALKGGSKDDHKEGIESIWVSIDWQPDAHDLRELVQYTVKQLNRFKAALESIVGLT